MELSKLSYVDKLAMIVYYAIVGFGSLVLLWIALMVILVIIMVIGMIF